MNDQNGMIKAVASNALSPQKRRLLELLLKEKGLAAETISPEKSRPPRPIQVPLGLNQEGLWFLDQLDPGKGHYNIPGAVRLRGVLNFAAFERSVNEIVRRHETLRTTFAQNAEGLPYQVIAPHQTIALPLRDLQQLPPAQREAEMLRLATLHAQRAFDLARGPLFHIEMLRLHDAEHVLLLNLHHIIADGWAMGVFTKELIALYSAFCEHRPSSLPELSLQYADYALWEREWMQGAVLETRLSYWKKQLGGKLPVLQLPADHPRPAVQSFHGRHHALQINAELTAALKALAQREGATLFMTLLAAFKALLHYYTKQNDLIVATGIANRERPEAESLIGYFATVLPLRTSLSGAPTFRELLQRVREVTLGATAHQGLPFARLVQEVQPERDPSRNPIYQAEFTLLTPDRNPAVYGYGMSAVQEVIQLPGLEMSAVEVEGGVSRFDLAVFIWDLPQGLCGTVEYGTDLFERATIARMISNFERLLQLIATAPETALPELSARLDLHLQQQRETQAQTYKDSMQQKLKSMKTRSARTSINSLCENVIASGAKQSPHS